MVFIYPGAIHIHSTHSDGSGTIEEIAHAAKRAGLSWIIITDHNNLSGIEGIYDGVSVIIGEEISPPDGNHYLALGIKTVISPDIPVADFIQKVKKQGGFGFIVHPDEKESRKNHYGPLSWQNWDIKDFGGIEIWNYMSNWADYYDEKNVFKTVKAYLFRNNVLSGPTKKVMSKWDELNNKTKQIIPAIGGVDAHSFDIKRGFVTVNIFPYKSTFKALTNFIYLDSEMPQDFESRKKIILNSIKSGKNLIMNRAWGRKKNIPEFYIHNKQSKAYSGDSIKIDTTSKMVIEFPLKSEIKIIHNGKIILQKKAKSIEFANLEKGKYRIEAYYKKCPWIFSNPILAK